LVARRAEVLAAVAAGGTHAVGDRAGAHVLVPLPDAATERAVITAAAARGVVVDGLGRHWASSVPLPPAGALVVGFAAPTRADLTRALPVLTGALREVLG
jgi:GntR family transcriptional regulator/MocR family aminotransferase